MSTYRRTHKNCTDIAIHDDVGADGVASVERQPFVKAAASQQQRGVARRDF